jgi:hypothetical protein
MAGPTDVLTEDVKDLRESNRRLGDEIKGAFDRATSELRDSNLRLTDAINGVKGDLGNFRVEVAKDLGNINATLQGFQGRTETSFKVAARGSLIAIATALGLFGATITGAWYAGHVDAAVSAMREHAKEQDARIAELIKMQQVRETLLKKTSPVPPYNLEPVPEYNPGVRDPNSSAVGPPSVEVSPGKPK